MSFKINKYLLLLLFFITLILSFFVFKKNKTVDLPKETIITVEIINENTNVVIKKTSKISFDILTKQFQDFINYSKTEKLIINFSNQEQLVNTYVSEKDEDGFKYGYDASLNNNEIHLYIYLNTNYLSKNQSKKETTNNIEWLIVESLFYLGQKINLPVGTPITPNYFNEVKQKFQLLNIDKDYLPLFLIEYK